MRKDSSLLQSIQGFSMNFAQLLKRLMVRKQFEMPTFELYFECFHAKNCRLHFEEKWRVIFLILLELPAGLCDDIELALGVHLGEDGPEATRGVFVPA
jgi:hypothetical protein